MKTVRKQILQRMLALVMTVCMVLGLLPAEPVKAETTGQLVIATNFEACDGGTVTWHNEETGEEMAGYSPAWHDVRRDWNIGSVNCYFGTRNESSDATIITKEDLSKGLGVAYAEKYKETEAGGDNTSYAPVEDISAYLTFDDVHYVSDEGKQTYENMISLKIKKAGAYKLTYEGSDLYINAERPRFGFYTSNAASDETFIDGTLAYSSEKESVTLYAILDVDPVHYNIASDSVTCVEGDSKKFEIKQDSTDTNVFHVTFKPKEMEDDEWANFEVTFNHIGSEEVAEAQPEKAEMWLSLKKICQGLVICTPDCNNDYAMPENPEYRKSIGQEILGLKREYYIGTLSAEGTFAPITSENELAYDSEILELTKHTDPERDGLYDISFKAIGSGSISCSYGGGTSSIDVTVVQNRIKIYGDEVCTEELERDEWGAYLWRDEDLKEAYVKIDTADAESTIEDAIYVEGQSEFSDENISIAKTNTPYVYKITRTGVPEFQIYNLIIRYQSDAEGVGGYDCQDIDLKLNLEDAFVGEGLYAVDELAYDIDWNVTGIQDGANWFKERKYFLGGVNLAFRIKDANGEITEEKVPVDALKIYEATRDENGNLTIDTKESPNATISRYRARPDIAELRFKKDTIFVVRYIPAGKEDEADNYQIVFDVTEGFPHDGWYTKPVMSLENLIMDSSGYTVKNGQNTIYLILKKFEGSEYVQSDQLTTVVNESINQLANSSVFTIEKYDGAIEGAQAAFKVTIKTKMACSIGLEYEMKLTHYDEEQKKDVTEIEQWKSLVNISYEGTDAIDNYEGDIVRYEGEDGTDWIGFSGVFISKESYESGQRYFKGRYPDGICYWVHGKTIQDVVDKLLNAVGTEVELWDILNDRPATITIPNTGYIELNMSYRDARYKDIYQAEQYVYAPASIKGILMTTADNPYMIQRLDTEGNPFYQDENCSGDDLTYYDDVMELPLTDAAYNAGKGRAKKLDGTSDTDNMKIVHGICMQMDGATEEEFDADTLAKLKDLLRGHGGTWAPIWDSAKQGYTGPYLVRKTIYEEATDTWKKTDYFYVLSNEDLAVNVWGEAVPLISRGMSQKPHRWPSLHINASTQVRIEGLWQDGAKLYIGFYDGEDTVYSDAYDTRFTNKDIGKNKTVTFEQTYLRVYDATANEVKTVASMTSDVDVHVVKAVSNTKIEDTYSEGTEKASIVVEKEAISDFVPMNEDETKQIIDGGTLDVDMSISKVDPEKESGAAAAIEDIDKKLNKNASGHAVDYVNVDLDYKIKANNGNAYGAPKKITETNEPIIISVPLNSSMKDKKNYYVYRHHDGKVEKLEAWIDEDTGNLCFETDQFSVYAIEAGDGETQPPTDGTTTGDVPNGGTSGGSASTDSSKTQTKPDGTTVETSTETKMDGTKVETTVETKNDGTKTETVVETAKDGSVKTTETVTQADGSATKTEKESETNSRGKDVAVTTTTKTDATGEVTAITEKSVIAQSSATTSTTVTVEKDADGTIKDASANIAKTIVSGNKATVAASIVAQIVEAAGTGDVQITMSVRDSDGKLKYKVEVSAEDLKAGEELYIYKRNTKTGEYTMVNAKTYEVSKNGNVAVSMSKKATYELVTEKQAAAINKEIRNTIKPKKSSATVEQGKTTRFALSAKANPDNIKSIVYTTSKKSVATVSKNGKITAKGTGTVIIQAKVTLMNGQIKTIRMKLRVKEEL